MPSDNGDLLLGAGLTGEVAIVTGASSGIGRALALLLEKAGMRICAVARDPEGLVSLKNDMQNPEEHLFLALNLAVAKLCESVVPKTLERFGSIFVLAHVAGAVRRKALIDVTIEDWDYQLNVNLRSGFLLNRAAGQAMIEGKKDGRIINFSSTAWQTGPMNGSDAYVAAKGGIVTMTRGFAGQYGPYGIRVNVIAPGQVNTPMQHVDNSPEIIAQAAALCPLRRIGEPEELARVALFIASDNASFINGATINVSGGLLMY
jgi:NAD(P)-dependent dehydrogenase (short-subunit alcohol dehydrogenase family)